ncbi:Na+/H+ antiporter NhaC family protein [Massilibacterium senegalense]|uniref:Na+/H+ antiporter NhaC family protein n=1 Tax=Massilibacterium senegalense TaxID=1632858 RepID=UPI000780D04E|nr:Na+/H+ antiporter NhaC family protein [Massilibacterium senegalense]
MEGTIYSTIPPLLAIVMIVITKRVLLSLGIGIVVGAFMASDFKVAEALRYLGNIALGIIYTEDGWNLGNIYILSFLFFLGMMTAVISVSGGSKAFGEWAIKKVKSRIGAQLLPIVLGIIIFIDDYFNALAVGSISRPVTDRFKVSRVKLAYYIDSTSAPVCAVSPISSWGAYIITLIGGVFVSLNITDVAPMTAFLQMIPMNYYVILAIFMLLAAAMFNLNIGPMKKHEERALQQGDVTNPAKRGSVVHADKQLPENEHGRVMDLLLPILVLIFSTFALIGYTGVKNTEGPVTFMAMLENTDVGFSLFIGGLVALVLSTILYFRHRLSTSLYKKGLWVGTKSMLPPIYILLLSWMIMDVISTLKTGEYFAGLVNQHIDVAYLPFLLFIVGALMAFSTGTSWGTFGIMLPIAGEIAMQTDVTLLLPIMAASISGTVFGDHCTPISDTAVLSSTGAGCDYMDHIITQLPYALIAALFSAIGYIVFGFTESNLFGFLTAFLLFVLFVFVINIRRKRQHNII